MSDLLKIVLEKGDHWSLGILLIFILLLALLKSPIFSETMAKHTLQIVMSILWGGIGLSAFYITIVLVRDLSRDKTEVERERIKASIALINQKSEVIKTDPSLSTLFERTSGLILSHPISTSGGHPIEDSTIDHNRYWIKTPWRAELLRRPNRMNDGVIATDIPQKIYYVLDKATDGPFNELFFKIKLDNGLEGWVRDWQVNKNPKCYD